VLVVRQASRQETNADSEACTDKNEKEEFFFRGIFHYK
jgi:hypothetical protein